MIWPILRARVPPRTENGIQPLLSHRYVKIPSAVLGSICGNDPTKVDHIGRCPDHNFEQLCPSGTCRKVFMSEIRISLGHPILIFVYSLVLLLIGCAIGMHWHQSPACAVWIVVAAASLMVIHDMFTGLIFASVTLRRLQRQQRHQQSQR